MAAIGGGVLLVVLALVLIFSTDEEERFDWEENYRYNTQQPYDNDLIYALLEASLPTDSFINIQTKLTDNFSPDKIDGPANYVFIGDRLQYNYRDNDSIMAFVYKGNNAFISANEITYTIAKRLRLGYCGEYNHNDVTRSYVDSIGRLNFIHPNLKQDTPIPFVYKPINKPSLYKWNYFFSEAWCHGPDQMATLGVLHRDLPNFIKIPYGEGYFYLHSNPIVFSNYYMRDSLGLEYAQKVFAHLPPHKTYWDEASRYFHYYDEDGGGNSQKSFGETELRYILSEPAMRWAFYTLLVGVALYIAFFMKRRQRVIPVMEPYANTSVEYAQTVGSLYFLKKEHRRLAEQQFKLFLGYVRNRYRIPTQHLDEELVKRISTNSKVGIEEVRNIIGMYNSFSSNFTITEAQLMAFNDSLEHFYKNCK